MPSPDELKARVEALLAAQRAGKQLQPPEPERPEAPAMLPTSAGFPPGMWDAYKGALPDMEPAQERSEAETKIDQALERVDIVEAYSIWCGKMTPQVGSKTESIMISCPMPDHADRNPSAWMNSDKGTWYCGACEEGGDKFDLAAIKHGFDRNTYKDGQNFGELRRAMAKDLGLQIDYVPGVGYTVWTAPDPSAVAAQYAPYVKSEPDQAPVSVPITQPSLPLNQYSLPRVYHPDDKDVPRLDWRSVATPGTFLDEYMQACTIDDVAEEYHFWHALLGLGLVNGRNVFLNDSPPVFSNFFLVLLGKTGSGKSKAKRYIVDVLTETAHYDPGAAASTGVKFLATPGSAEVLIDSFSKPILDTSNPKRPQVIGYHEVRGLIDFNEFKALTARMGRLGSTMETTLMEFYDSARQVTTQSRTYGESVAENPHASLLATVQPEVLHDLFDQIAEDSGFLNRFIFAGGPRKEVDAFPDDKPNLSTPISKMREIIAWGKTMRRVEVTSEAKDLFKTERKGRIQTDMDTLGNPFARIDLTLKKLCLILAINEMSERLTLEIMQKALLIYPYLRDFVSIRATREAPNKVATFETNVLNRMANKVKILPNVVPGVTARDLVRLMPRNTSMQELNRTLAELERASVLEVISVPPGPKGGRPKKLYWFKDPETYLAYVS